MDEKPTWPSDGCVDEVVDTAMRRLGTGLEVLTENLPRFRCGVTLHRASDLNRDAGNLRKRQSTTTRPSTLLVYDMLQANGRQLLSFHGNRLADGVGALNRSAAIMRHDVFASLRPCDLVVVVRDDADRQFVDREIAPRIEFWNQAAVQSPDTRIRLGNLVDVWDTLAWLSDGWTDFEVSWWRQVGQAAP